MNENERNCYGGWWCWMRKKREEKKWIQKKEKKEKRTTIKIPNPPLFSPLNKLSLYYCCLFLLLSFSQYSFQLYSQLRVYEQHAFFCKSIPLKCRRTREGKKNHVFILFYFTFSPFSFLVQNELWCEDEIHFQINDKLISKKKRSRFLFEGKKTQKRFNLISVQWKKPQKPLTLHCLI